VNRRHTIGILALTLALDAGRPAGIPAQTQRPALAVTALEAVGMTVDDMDRSLDFYTRVLSFEAVSDVEAAGQEYERLEGVFGARMRVVRLKLGGEFIELTDYLAPRGRPYPYDTRSNDRWFQHIAIIVSDMDRAYRWLREHKVEHASTGPQRLPDWNPNAGGIEAFYFRDPDGHFLEVLHFPPGKGDPKWHQRTDRLFLGIDHTAIVVWDTERSLGFYRDALGFSVAGGAENYGVEQEHLNNVFGARLRITSLKTQSGPAIEFLEYLAPRDGRPAPQDLKANDLAHWQIRLVAQKGSLTGVQPALSPWTWVSPGVISTPKAELGFTHGGLVRDPDGHALLMIEK
jgi:catechol 2,3-dioxygenase-like lactoylglutathione lyase family enzyme